MLRYGVIAAFAASFLLAAPALSQQEPPARTAQPTEPQIGVPMSCTNNRQAYLAILRSGFIPLTRGAVSDDGSVFELLVRADEFTILLRKNAATCVVFRGNGLQFNRGAPA